jgi:hypothetical protein
MSAWTVIAHTEVGSGGAATIDFTSISNSYTDLAIMLSLRTNRNATYDDFRIQLNSSDGTSRILYGNGTTTGNFTQPTILTSGGSGGGTTTSNTFGNAFVYIPNYASTTTFKSIYMDGVQEHNATTAYQSINAGLWSDNSAINAVKIQPGDGTLLSQYSSATLYGITKGSSGGVTVS